MREKKLKQISEKGDKNLLKHEKSSIKSPRGLFKKILSGQYEKKIFFFQFVSL